jgi:hypothetical protein
MSTDRTEGLGVPDNPQSDDLLDPERQKALGEGVCPPTPRALRKWCIEVQSSPTFQAAPDAFVAHAWKCMRRLAGQLNCGHPPEPVRSSALEDNRRHLDTVIAWCTEQIARQKVYAIPKGPCGNPSLKYFAKASGTPLSVFEHLAEDSQYPEWEAAAHAAGYRDFSCCPIRSLTNAELDKINGEDRKATVREPLPPEPYPNSRKSLSAKVKRIKARLSEKITEGHEPLPMPSNVPYGRADFLFAIHDRCLPSLKHLWIAMRFMKLGDVPEYPGDPQDFQEALAGLDKVEKWCQAKIGPGKVKRRKSDGTRAGKTKNSRKVRKGNDSAGVAGDYLDYPPKMRKLLFALRGRGKVSINDVRAAVYGPNSKIQNESLLRLKDRTNKRLATDGKPKEIKKAGETLELKPI